ncbi:hypothetical protein RHIZ_20685 [Rhizobium skierniewicense]|nr:hypothetical protein [Rhizobium sp. CFBP 13644]MBD8694167.1 hypothetical protein [Rhizobium sp. CFBP 13717]MCI9868388.1 hypothetical protein [Rhizobium skierniewicense]
MKAALIRRMKGCAGSAITSEDGTNSSLTVMPNVLVPSIPENLGQCRNLALPSSGSTNIRCRSCSTVAIAAQY